MTNFLLGLGGAIIGFALMCTVGYVWVKRKIRGFAEAFAQFAGCLDGGLPPFRVTLELEPDADWDRPGAVEACASGLERKGYRRVGDYTIPEMDDVRLRAFWHPSALTYAVIYEHPSAGIVGDVVQQFENGDYLTVTTAPEDGLDRPDQAPIVRIGRDLEADSGSVGDLHDRLLAERGGRTPTASTAEGFVAAFTDAYAREMDWRIARGGVTAEEVRRVGALDGGDEPDEDAVERVQCLWRCAIGAFIREQAEQRFIASNPMPVDEWEEKRDRVFVVHDRMDGEDLVEELSCSLIEDRDYDDDDEAEERALDDARRRLSAAFDGTTVREGFASAQALLPETQRYERIGAVDEPWAAEVYLAPE